jgi:hypothetical protein
MQKFFNYLILRIIQDSSVSNTSHHPQLGEKVKRAILVTVIPICIVEEIKRESRMPAFMKLWDYGLCSRLTLQRGVTGPACIQ